MALRIFSFLAIPSLTLASADEGAHTAPTEKTTTEKGKRRIRREVSPYEMSLGPNGLRHERTAHDFGAVTRGVGQDRQEAYEH